MRYVINFKNAQPFYYIEVNEVKYNLNNCTIIEDDGRIVVYKNNHLQYILDKGVEMFFKDGLAHKENGPAFIFNNENFKMVGEQYWVEGKLIKSNMRLS